MGKDDGKQQRFLFPRRTKRCGLALCGMGDGKVSSMWSCKRPSGGGVSAAALLQHVGQIARGTIQAIKRKPRTRKGPVRWWPKQIGKQNAYTPVPITIQQFIFWLTQ